MDNIEELLRALSEDDGSPPPAEENINSSQGGLLDGLDLDAIMKIMGLLEQMNKPDDNERFLLALKPLLRDENRTKIDSAVKILKLLALLPILKESGIFGKLI